MSVDSVCETTLLKNLSYILTLDVIFHETGGAATPYPERTSIREWLVGCLPAGVTIGGATFRVVHKTGDPRWI